MGEIGQVCRKTAQLLVLICRNTGASLVHKNGHEKSSARSLDRDVYMRPVGVLEHSPASFGFGGCVLAGGTQR